MCKVYKTDPAWYGRYVPIQSCIGTGSMLVPYVLYICIYILVLTNIVGYHMQYYRYHMSIWIGTRL